MRSKLRSMKFSRIVVRTSWGRLRKENENMCDEHFDEDANGYLRLEAIAHRQFGRMSVEAGMTILLPRAEGAVAVAESEVNVKTPDGTADCYFVHPLAGTAAGVVVWPDILGRGLRSGR